MWKYSFQTYIRWPTNRGSYCDTRLGFRGTINFHLVAVVRDTILPRQFLQKSSVYCSRKAVTFLVDTCRGISCLQWPILKKWCLLICDSARNLPSAQLLNLYIYIYIYMYIHLILISRIDILLHIDLIISTVFDKFAWHRFNTCVKYMYIALGFPQKHQLNAWCYQTHQWFRLKTCTTAWHLNKYTDKLKAFNVINCRPQMVYE